MESAYELKSGGLSHETQADLGLCSMVVLVVVPCEAQRALVTKPLVEKTVTQLRLPVADARAVVNSASLNLLPGSDTDFAQVLGSCAAEFRTIEKPLSGAAGRTSRLHDGRDAASSRYANNRIFMHRGEGAARRGADFEAEAIG